MSSGKWRIEDRLLGYVPADERHGHPRVLFPMWFAINLAIIAMVLGSIGIAAGMNLLWTCIAIVVGNAVGAIFMALHSVQGPKIGMPQMIQSRAQFGVEGAALPLMLIVVMYLGYASSNTVIAAQAVTAVSPVPVSVAVIVTTAVTALVVLFGYDMIHRVQKLLTVISGLFYIAVTIFVLRLSLPAGSWSLDGFDAKAFLLMAGVAGTWQLTYAPYVADYSRYLPESTKGSKTFIYTYAGTTIGAIWLMALGAAVALGFPKFFDNTSVGLQSLMGSGWKYVIFGTIIIGVMLGNAVNLYGCFITSTTILQTWVKLKAGLRTRLSVVVGCALAIAVIGVAGHANFVDNFSNFINFLAYFIFPWTSVNLADYFFVRRGSYRPSAMFDKTGPYGRYNLKALLPYLLTIVLEVPFIDTSIYQGYIAKHYDVDVAWLIAIVVPGLLYTLLMRRRPASGAPETCDRQTEAGRYDSPANPTAKVRP